MNENILLEDEDLFMPNLYEQDRRLYIKRLKQKGITTVGDFINTDISDLTKRQHSYTRYGIKSSYRILKYKYQGKKIVEDVYLDETIREDDFNVISKDGKVEYDCPKMDDLFNLGFTYSYSSDIDKFYKDIYMETKEKEIPAIDIIKKIMEKFSCSTNTIIGTFYINYYKKEFMSSKSNVEDLATMKNELYELVNQRNSLDLKISQLAEQIKALEGGKITNARK